MRLTLPTLAIFAAVSSSSALAQTPPAASGAAPASQWPDDPTGGAVAATWGGTGAEAGRRRSSFDPLVPAAITTLAIGGTAALAGGSSIEGPPANLETCGLSGCITHQDPYREPNWGLPFLAGGLTTTAGGLTLLLVSVTDPAEHADAGRARVAAGGVPLSLGAGLAVTGITANAMGRTDATADAMIGVGLVTSAIAIPFVLWGASTWDESRGDRYASTGRIVGGTILTGVGVLGVSSAALIVASTADCGGPLCGVVAIAALPFLAVGGAGLGVGLPLLANGSQTVEENGFVPDITAGATSLDAKWRFQ